MLEVGNAESMLGPDIGGPFGPYKQVFLLC